MGNRFSSKFANSNIQHPEKFQFSTSETPPIPCFSNLELGVSLDVGCWMLEFSMSLWFPRRSCDVKRDFVDAGAFHHVEDVNHHLVRGVVVGADENGQG